jgi:hypothetical protein
MVCKIIETAEMQAPGKTVVACKNCRHFLNDVGFPFTLKYGKCSFTREDIPSRVDPVDGTMEKPVVNYSYASTARKPYGGCGVDGKLFELETDRVRMMCNRYAAPAKTAAAIVGVVVAWNMLYWLCSHPPSGVMNAAFRQDLRVVNWRN